jgi:hypothetical protein
MPPHAHVCPLKRFPPPTGAGVPNNIGDVLGGQFVVIINLKAHVSNKGAIIHPILGMEDEVCNFFSQLVNCMMVAGFLAVGNSPQS